MEAVDYSDFFPVRGWSEAVARALSKATGGAADLIAAEVQAGAAEVYGVRGRGVIVTRLELDTSRPCLVLVAGAGKDARGVVRYLVKLCRARGWFFRFHTQHKGLARLVGCDLVPAGIGLDGYKIYSTG